MDPLDHHFIAETAQASSDRRWVKKIQSEWSILQRNLPDTIYVRVYEDRMDLLRAVILGAPSTPYHDGLFVFDFYFPPGYPHTPPLAHYHSGGLRLNPNLYENGKVCLSLLNTWTGQGTEVWNPSTSSILQVLVSIQGLVLNAKPYFNEAGYDRQVGTAEGEKNAVLYNENAFLLSCKSMLYLLRRPLMHLEVLIQQHFVQHGAGLLKSCEAYLQGALVGSLADGNNYSTTVTDSKLVAVDKSSAGFMLMLTKLHIRLKTAFTELGVDCSL
jgi:ubiquitin-conjugating enzyme E2 O